MCRLHEQYFSGHLHSNNGFMRFMLSNFKINLLCFFNNIFWQFWVCFVLPSLSFVKWYVHLARGISVKVYKCSFLNDQITTNWFIIMFLTLNIMKHKCHWTSKFKLIKIIISIQTQRTFKWFNPNSITWNTWKKKTIIDSRI